MFFLSPKLLCCQITSQVQKKRQVNGLECSLNFSDLQHRFFCMYVIQPLDVSAVGQYSKGSKPHYSGLDFIYWHLEQCGFL